MNGCSTKLRFGVSYCPYAKSGDVDISLWERDFRTMKKLNFNTMRCFIAWDRMEHQEGETDFSKTDYIFELAEKYDIEVILNIGGVFATYGGIYPPRWLIYDYHCQEIVEDPRLPKQSFGPVKKLCLDDEVYRQKAEKFTTIAIKRYSDQSMLCGWNVWNEPHLKPQCYCPITLAKFRDWLKNKYSNDLDKLNRIWGTEFPVLYRDWNDVEPGLDAGFLSGGYVARMDWLKFNRERVASWVKGVRDLVHQYDPLKRPATCNVVTTAVYANASWHEMPDIWSQSRSLDISGFSYYTEFDSAPHISAGLSALRGSSNDPAKGFWILENEAGQRYHEEYAPAEVNEGARHESALWLSVLHGAKSILLWKFGGRMTDGQTDCWNLTAWDGSITNRAQRNGDFALKYISHEKLFLERTYRSEVAILHSCDNAVFSRVSGCYGDWDSARFGAHRIFKDMQIPADFVSETQVIEDSILSRYRILVLPAVMSMNKTIADKIADFVKNGGIVIADQKTAVFDENGVNLSQAPGLGLSDLFGGYINDYLLGPSEMNLELNNGNMLNVDGNMRSIIHVKEARCEVLARWPDKTPAIISNPVKNGRVLWFGCQVFRQYDQAPDAQLLQFFKAQLNALGIDGDYEVSGDNLTGDIEIGALSDEKGGRVYFLVNLGPEEKTFKLKIKSVQSKLYDILAEKSYDFMNGSCEICLSPWKTIILTRSCPDTPLKR